MYKVGADRMAPVNPIMDGTHRVVLVEHMVLPIPMDKPVGIVHPIGGWQEMIPWTVRVFHGPGI
jgi:hypothetical protein